jgi:hypothetical protein
MLWDRLRYIKRLFLLGVICAVVSSCGGENPGSTVEVSNGVSLAAIPTELRAGATLGRPRWTAAATGATGPVAGVTCLTNESYHIHSHISIFENGERLAIPQNIGLTGCALELHTHDASGIIHIETSAFRSFTLGQFFSVWGQPLSSSNVAGITGLPVTIYVIDGNSAKAVSGDFLATELLAHRSIAIVIGSPPLELPIYKWPSGL